MDKSQAGIVNSYVGHVIHLEWERIDGLIEERQEVLEYTHQTDQYNVGRESFPLAGVLSILDRPEDIDQLPRFSIR